MKDRVSWLAIAVAAALLAGCGGQDSAGPPPQEAEPVAVETAEDTGITARALLAEAIAEAGKWQPDAQLAGVSTSLAEGPTHAFWFYDFQSPSTGTCTRIRALAGKRVENVGSGDSCVLMKPVSADFVDSPAAFDSARAAGFEPGDSVQFGLRFQSDQALPAPRECWVLWGDADGDEQQGIIRGWCVDPVDGAFVTRLSGYGRTEPLQ